MDAPELYFDRLKAIHLFKGLSDQAVLGLAQKLQLEQHPANTTVVEEGDEEQDFYIVHQGQAAVMRQQPDGTPQQISTLYPGDYFGEAALIRGRARSSTIITETPTELLRLNAPDFQDLLRAHPEIRPNLLATAQSRALYQQVKLNWLGKDEVVYMLARRHVFMLFQGIALPLAVALLTAFGVLAVYLAFGWEWATGLGVVGGLIAFAWLGWAVVDWSNDYYIITNQRLIYQERLLGFHDTRDEAPLRTILSINVQTSGPAARALGMGDVIVKTQSKTILIKAVGNPYGVATLIEEHWRRSQFRERLAEIDAMKHMIRQRIQPETAQKGGATTTKAASGVARFLDFKTRFEAGGTITYRKHTFLLLRQMVQPTITMVFTAFVFGLALDGLFPEGAVTWAGLGIGLLGMLGALGWGMYEVEDWRNDLYQVTPDEIKDLDRSPLGSESLKSASLEHIVGLSYNRPGLLGSVLNFGDVLINAGEEEFSFEGVADPVGVQNDIHRRMEAYKVRKIQREAAKRRDEIADWLMAYHQLAQDLDDEGRKPPSKK